MNAPSTSSNKEQYATNRIHASFGYGSVVHMNPALWIFQAWMGYPAVQEFWDHPCQAIHSLSLTYKKLSIYLFQLSLNGKPWFWLTQFPTWRLILEDISFSPASVLFLKFLQYALNSLNLCKVPPCLISSLSYIIFLKNRKFNWIFLTKIFHSCHPGWSFDFSFKYPKESNFAKFSQIQLQIPSVPEIWDLSFYGPGSYTQSIFFQFSRAHWGFWNTMLNS